MVLTDDFSDNQKMEIATRMNEISIMESTRDSINIIINNRKLELAEKIVEMWVKQK